MTAPLPRYSTRPYEILEEIGRGAMGVVYRARDVGSGELVALKTMAVAHADSFGALRREIIALSRVRHPGVVRVVYEAVTHGRPWYAMELLTGPTLEDYLREPRPLATLLTIAARIAASLDCVHGHGVVHRDLKPSNIFLRDPLTPVLTDFGLATQVDGRLGREVMDSGGGLAGTPLYLSPEIIRGGLADARADLYALGCILCEMLTGSPPFEGSPTNVLWAHLQEIPKAPSLKNPLVTPTLDALVLRLLAKNPTERYGYARDVVAALLALGAEVSVPDGAVYLYRPAIVGRSPLLSDVRERVSALSHDHGGHLLISGESGVGKTRLVLEAASHARTVGIHVVESTCTGASTPSGAPSARALLHAFAPLLRHVADRCTLYGSGEADGLLGEHAALLARYEPALAVVLGPPHDLPATLDVDAAMRRIQTAMCFTVRALADIQPLLLIFDDLHRADELSLAVLSAIVTELSADAKVLVLGLYRASEAPAELTRVVRGNPASTRVVDRLTDASVRSIVGDMLATETPPPALVDFVTLESEGNPFFVVEYLRAAVEADILRRTPDAEWTFHPPDTPGKTRLAPGMFGVPAPLRTVLQDRFKHLADADREVLATAAVLGRESPVGLLAAMVGEGPLEDALAELYARQILEPSGARAVRFSHDRLREEVYVTIPEAVLLVKHRDAARAIEATLDDPLRPVSDPALAYHWERAGDFSRAAVHLVRAGEDALASGAAAEARVRLERALALMLRAGAPVSSHALARTERLLGAARLHLGDVPGMLTVVGPAYARLSRADVQVLPGDSPPEIPSGVGLGWDFTKHLAGEALRILGVPDSISTDPAERSHLREFIRVAEQLSQGWYYQQQPVRTLWAALAAARSAGRLGPSRELAWTHATLAVTCSFVPWRSLSAAYITSATQAAEYAQDPGSLAVVGVYSGLVALADGAFALASERLSKAESVAHEHHDRRREREAIALQGNVAYLRGDIHQSLAVYQRLESVAQASDDDQVLAWAMSGVIGCWMILGRDAEAIDLLAHSAVMASKDRSRAEPLAHGNIAEAYLHLGRVDDALQVAEGHHKAFRDAPATSFQGIYGWTAAFDAFAAGCQRERPRSPRWWAYLARATDCTRILGAYARMFRVGRAPLARCVGSLFAMVGMKAPARGMYERSRREALAIGARYEEARACIALCGVIEDGAKRRECQRRAVDVLSDFRGGYWQDYAAALERSDRGEPTR